MACKNCRSRQNNNSGRCCWNSWHSRKRRVAQKTWNRSQKSSAHNSTDGGTANGWWNKNVEGEAAVQELYLGFYKEDTAEGGKFEGKKVHRFPPEPNGYLHIGHAKALCIDFGTAEHFGGICNLRMDDTNPTKEDVEYIDAIKEGYQSGLVMIGTTDFSMHHSILIRCTICRWAYQKGLAYVCELTPDKVREYRGDTQTPTKSPVSWPSYRRKPWFVWKNENGEFEWTEKWLSVQKIDLTSGNFNIYVIPVIYRWPIGPGHHRTGDKWCIYPMWLCSSDWGDALEGITHSLCSLEFEAHRPLYDWVINNISVPCKPRQIEFARLGINNTVMSAESSVNSLKRTM